MCIRDRLGSTGSIGTQSLDVARAQGYKVLALAAGKNVDRMLQQIAEFAPKAVAMADAVSYTHLVSKRGPPLV